MAVPVDEEIVSHREVLLRYARVHLRDAAAAEDAVQDTFLAALQARATFRGDSTLRTWLIGILRRKLVDRMRRAGTEVTQTDAGLDLTADPDESGLLARLFDQAGHWAAGPRTWADPQAALEQDGFWRAFEACVGALPPRAARVFVMRELVGLGPEEVCQECAISASNYWVIMHRARLRLRECLERCWFSPDETRGAT
ncbi:MAG: sigma-70 family RNA polymerase sigma factor [Gammaproteobacteria bacterium]|nr:sigma-70 family RNA polymerase sigma factor [Gammaproteobacteria bacterium]